MSTLKKWLLIFLVVAAFLATGLGGLQDMLGIDLIVTKQHGWNDGIFLILTAILVAITLR
jgi:hypothetical protein